MTWYKYTKEKVKYEAPNSVPNDSGWNSCLIEGSQIDVQGTIIPMKLLGTRIIKENGGGERPSQSQFQAPLCNKLVPARIITT